MIKELTKEPVKMHVCPHCGYEWESGKYGGHNCLTVMKQKILEIVLPLNWKAESYALTARNEFLSPEERKNYRRMAIDHGVLVKQLQKAINPGGVDAKQG